MSGKKSFSRGKEESNKELTSKPFKKGLSGVKIEGPSCIVCGLSIDTGLGFSKRLLSGNKRSQRQGWMHDSCEEVEGKKYYEEKWNPLFKSGEIVGYAKTVVKNEKLEVPIFWDFELDRMIEGKDNES